MLFPTEDWVMFTWSRSLPFMIPSTLIREQQTHRRLAKSQPLYQSSSDESWTLITVSSDKSKSFASDPGCRQSIDWEGQNKRSRSSLICWGWGVYKLGWTQQAIEWNSGELYSVLLIRTYRPKPDFTNEDLWDFTRPECNRLWNNPGPYIHHAGVWRSTCSPSTNRYV